MTGRTGLSRLTAAHRMPRKGNISTTAVIRASQSTFTHGSLRRRRLRLGRPARAATPPAPPAERVPSHTASDGTGTGAGEEEAGHAEDGHVH
ncbi:hypothetical protein GCM10010320_73090 [Streptomyces caelestis]|nr:hypothetical protein GCM10010320_73090 [Streptomyces caelestis]